MVTTGNEREVPTDHFVDVYRAFEHEVPMDHFVDGSRAFEHEVPRDHFSRVTRWELSVKSDELHSEQAIWYSKK